MTAVRILTVRQPWAWAIIHGGKGVENRVRNIAGGYRGPVAIHAGLRYDSAWQSRVLDDAMQASGARCEPGDPPWWGDLGAIIGVVDLVDVHSSDDPDHDRTLRDEEFEVARFTGCSLWSEPEAWHLVLANPRALDEPIPYRGALGLRKTEFAVVNDYLVAPWDHGPRSCTPYGCEPWCNFEPVARLVATS